MLGRNKIKTIFIIYWILLIYVLAALIWWYIALSHQNQLISTYKQQLLTRDSDKKEMLLRQIEDEKKRKTAQYIGEGSIFFLLIAAGAAFLYRTVKKELKLSIDQQNFMVAVTHELKTPLAVAKLNLETMQRRQLDEAQQNKLIGNTIAETNRMNALCSNLLLNSQMEAGGYQIADETIILQDLVKQTVIEYQRRYPERTFLAENISDQMQLHTDSFLLQMALNNLLDNAVKYTAKETLIRIRPYSSGNKLCLEVKDEGPGIPDAEKNQVFEKYSRLGNTATQRSKGTGLGLYLVKRITKVLNGQIMLTDNQPSGCKFTITLKSN